MPLERLRWLVLLLTGKPTRPRKRKRAKPRDFQRTRVYRWEAAHVLPHAAEPLTLEACRTLVAAVFHWAGRPAPVVTDGRGRRHACGSPEAIKLPRWARTRAIVLHECAHGLARDMHGPEFVAIYVLLLERFAGLDQDALRASLTAARVAVAPPSHLPARPSCSRRKTTMHGGADGRTSMPDLLYPARLTDDCLRLVHGAGEAGQPGPRSSPAMTGENVREHHGPSGDGPDPGSPCRHARRLPTLGEPDGRGRPPRRKEQRRRWWRRRFTST